MIIIAKHEIYAKGSCDPAMGLEITNFQAQFEEISESFQLPIALP